MKCCIMVRLLWSFQYDKVFTSLDVENEIEFPFSYYGKTFSLYKTQIQDVPYEVGVQLQTNNFPISFLIWIKPRIN